MYIFFPFNYIYRSFYGSQRLNTNIQRLYYFLFVMHRTNFIDEKEAEKVLTKELYNYNRFFYQKVKLRIQ